MTVFLDPSFRRAQNSNNAPQMLVRQSERSFWRVEIQRISVLSSLRSSLNGNFATEPTE